MKRYPLISALTAAALVLLASACSRTMEEEMPGSNLPEGTPITMRINFGTDDIMNLDVSTKAEASPADEERIHDLYVMIFCDGEGEGHVTRGQKIYGRYFSYEHLQSSLSALDSSPNEGWFVENRTIDNSVVKTRGAVKISTKVCSSAKLVVIANVDNGICKLGNLDDVLDYLNGIRTYDQLRQTQVKLTQDIVHRKDLFLMLGIPEDGSGNPKNVNTGEMVWGTTSPETAYDPDYRVYLKPVDAKVKFKVHINSTNISAAKAVYWEVCNVPNRCYLFSDYDGGRAPEGTVYFGTEQAYFEETVEEGGDTWYVFSFYMLESRFAAKAHADEYHLREKQTKTNTDKTGYGGDDSEYYVENGDWVYALPNAPYVKFDMILTLTPDGITALGGTVNHALTSDTIFTVHLGDFSNAGFDDYNTLRGTYYTYEITIVNSGSIYAEVKSDNEIQPGQEGYLLLTDDEIVNADCHYEYHSITFTYDPETSPEKFSWYVKTPFTSAVGGGPQKSYKTVGGIDYPLYDPHDTDGILLDYRWVKFGINKIVGDEYTTNRLAYPGDNAYNKDWGVGENGPWNSAHPTLLDISQLIQYIFEETRKETASPGSSDFKTDSSTGEKVIRATIFIDEFYYESDPRIETNSPQADPNLWRQFVNAHPREMHILSKTVQSRDRKSDVIESSHSVIQQSIQTIYNVYEPTLRSIWGCEHLDEIKQKEPAGAGDWLYWPAGCIEEERYGANSDIGKENGRLNSAYIWGIYNRQDNNGSMVSPRREWSNFLNYEVDNKVPELRDDDTDGSHHYQGMAWSCLTRNRDNDGNGFIDPEEIRWYLAASQQLIGMWVGTESLSTSARLYQPAPGQWRAHVVSSTEKRVAWSEEGAGATEYRFDFPPSGGPSTDYHTWASASDAAVGESVRCLRNIGTYDEDGKVKDISSAPVTVVPDRYFTLERNSGESVSSYHSKITDPGTGSEYYSDDFFIFSFNRLNTKSIREFSPSELPYHDQMSLNNRVYVKMITQPYSTILDEFNVKNGDVNSIITQKGYNDYCPPGYRFPNHTEWLLMELYLPSQYLQGDKKGNCPSRTYYNRGYYGNLRSDTEPWSTEKNKVGWIYSDKMHCSPYNQTLTRSRCVKDEDQTGFISGQIAVEGNTIYPGEVVSLDFKFSSTASTFNSATLTLWYTKNGFRTPYDLTSQLRTPTGLQYKGAQSIRIPSLTELGLPTTDFSSADVSIEASFTNLNGLSGSHELPVTMRNPISGIINADEFFYPADSQGGSFTYNISTVSRTVDLASASFKLCYTDQTGNPREQAISTIPLSGKTSSGASEVSMPSLSTLGLDTFGANLNHPMTIEATITATNGLTYTTSSSIVSLVSHLTGSSIQFPTDYDNDNGIPINVTVESVNDRATATSATFYWKREGDASYTASIPLSGTFSTYVKDIIGEDLSESNKGKFYFYFTTSCSDGTSITSDVWSMNILYYGKCWNSGTYHNNNQLNVSWPVESITDLDFEAGDFIDTYMDVTHCTYYRVNGQADKDIGMDNLISIGTSTDLNWRNGDIYFYYPAHSPAEAPDEERLQVSIKDNNNTVTRLRPYDLDGSLTIRLSKDLLLVNGAELDYSDDKGGNNSAGANSNTRSRNTISSITNSSTVKIGSVEGKHRSRATYNYVRVVRNEGPLTP